MKRTIRSLLKWSYPANVLLLALVVADYLYWGSQGMVVLLSLMALLLIAVTVLLVMEERPKYLRLPRQPREPPITLIYGRTRHGRP